MWFSVFTADKSAVFSRNAPTQPVKPIINATVPQQMSINAGSSIIFVSFVEFLNVSFSFHAQTPTANIQSPAN